MVRKIFKEILKQNEITPEAWKKMTIKSEIQRRRHGTCWKLPPDLLIASVVQIVHAIIVQQNFPRFDQHKRKIRLDTEAHTRQRTTS